MARQKTLRVATDAPRRALRTALAHGDEAFVDGGARLARRTLDMPGPGVVVTLIG